MATIGTLQRITAPELRDLLLLQATSGTKDVAVIDVRDDDHIGGHIKTSQHIPSSTHDHALPILVHTHAKTPILVFHCQLSQVRGPKAALGYLRARERILGKDAVIGETSVGEKLRKSAGENKKGNEGEGEWMDEEDTAGRRQKVYVLQDGFQGWQALYGEDEKLTEGYSKELWQDDYD